MAPAPPAARPSASLDAIARQAAALAQTPIALITFIDDDARQWVRATVGLQAHETDRLAAFCAWAVHSADVLWVEDAAADARFADHPLVHEEPPIRHYAAAPIQTAMGLRLGAICVIDRVPRPVDPAVPMALARLAREAATTLRADE